LSAGNDQIIISNYIDSILTEEIESIDEEVESISTEVIFFIYIEYNVYIN